MTEAKINISDFKLSFTLGARRKLRNSGFDLEEDLTKHFSVAEENPEASQIHTWHKSPSGRAFCISSNLSTTETVVATKPWVTPRKTKKSLWSLLMG